MNSVSKFDLWMYRITTYIVYPLFILSKIFDAVFVYNNPVQKIISLFWVSVASVLFLGLHKKWKFSFYMHYVPLFLQMVGSAAMIVFMYDVFNDAGGLNESVIFLFIICIAFILLSTFLMYKWWDVKPLFYSENGIQEVNSHKRIDKLKEKLSTFLLNSLKMVFIIFIWVLSILSFILPIYATIVDAQADRIAWAVMDILAFPIGMIRGICFFFGWM